MMGPRVRRVAAELCALCLLGLAGSASAQPSVGQASWDEALTAEPVEPLPPPPPPPPGGASGASWRGGPLVEPPAQPAPVAPSPWSRQAPALGAPPWLGNQWVDELDYHEGDPMVPGYVLDSRPRRGLVVAGAIVAGAPWLASAGFATVAAVNGYGEGTWFYLPVAGPLIYAVGYEDDDKVTPIFVLDSIAQGTGLTLLVVGLAARKTYLRRIVQGELVVTPLLGSDHRGVGLLGSF